MPKSSSPSVVIAAQACTWPGCSDLPQAEDRQKRCVCGESVDDGLQPLIALENEAKARVLMRDVFEIQLFDYISSSSCWMVLSHM